MARSTTLKQLHQEADKVGRLQSELDDAAKELQQWVTWAKANDKVTKQEAERLERKIARYHMFSQAALRSDWEQTIQTCVVDRGNL